MGRIRSHMELLHVSLLAAVCLSQAALDESEAGHETSTHGTHPLLVSQPLIGGSFEGHVIPGLAFLVCGLRWFGQFIYEHMIHSDKPYVPRPLHSRTDVVLCWIFTSIGIAGELHNARFWETRSMLYVQASEAGDGLVHFNANNVQHIQFYLSFMLCGVAAACEFWLPRYTPQHSAMVMLAVAFAIDGFQWCIHSIAKERVHAMQHMMFCLLSVATAITCLLELNSMNRKLLAVRSFLLMMTGSWFLTMAVLMKTGLPLDVLVNHRPIPQHQAPDGVLMMINASLFTQAALTWLFIGGVAYAAIQAMLVWCGKLRFESQSSHEYEVVSVVLDQDCSIKHSNDFVEIEMGSQL